MKDKIQYKVLGISDYQMPVLIEQCPTIKEAQRVIDNLREKEHLVYYNEVVIVKESQTTVHIMKTNETPAVPDYERQGVVQSSETLRSDTQDLRNLYASLRADLSVVETDTIPFLEERFVGLRHELLNDVEDIQDDVEDLRDEVAALRREMESLRGEEDS